MTWAYVLLLCGHFILGAPRGMAMAAIPNPKGTHDEVTEIIQFLKNGEKALRISPIKDVVLVLGLTGGGKSTFTQFLTGNDEYFEAVEQGVDTGEFIIRDRNNKVCNSTIDSCTTIPDLIVDKVTKIPFYDNPGFSDTRDVKHDISVTYFIKKVLDSAHSVKLVFVVNYPSVRRGVDRVGFMNLVKNAVNMIKDVDKFKDSIALIVTKVDNQYLVKRGVVTLVPDANVINNIVAFLEEVKVNLISKPSQQASETAQVASSLTFIDALLKKDGGGYPKIGIFRRPDEAGKLNSPLMLRNKELLRKVVHENIEFTQCESEDFGYTVSPESVNRMYEIVDQVNKKIGSDVRHLAKEIEEGFLLLERDDNDVETLYTKFHFGFVSMQNITKVEKPAGPREFLMKIRETAGVLNLDISGTKVRNILHNDGFLKFINRLSGIPTSDILEWVEGLRDVIQSFDDSQKWYYFLVNLRATLLKHEVQIDISKNSSALDFLRDRIQAYRDDDSLVKESLKHFLALVYKRDLEKEFDAVKNAKLNSWKLQFLYNMLDFQVLTLCRENKLTVIGSYVHLSDVARKRCDRARFVEIFALNKLFIDEDFDRTGSKIQMTILAPTWDVIGSPKIVLDGEPGWEHIIPKAAPGAGPGADGEDGNPGFPGGAAGNFIGFGRKCVNCQFLKVSVNGGTGGKGQDGGDGRDGRDGIRPEKANDYENIFNIGIITVSHEDKGNKGQRGGDGGMGGEGGMGGSKGRVMIVMFDTPEANLPRTTAVDGTSGKPGDSGLAGSGGNASNGNFNHQLNGKGMKQPEQQVELVNPSHVVNHYKAYLRENLGRSLSRHSLGEFLDDLDSSEEVISLYDTLGLVNDLQCLENQYHKLQRQIPLLPFYKSLLEKIEQYARDPPYSEMSGQHKKVLASLYVSTLSKVCTIDYDSNNDLIINVRDYFGTAVKDMDQLLKEFLVAKQRNDHRASFQKMMVSKIKEANDFIKNDVTKESQAILSELDGEIQALVHQTQHLKNITREEAKKLNEHMLSRGISSVIRIASKALDFFGLLGMAAEGVIESTDLISKSLAFDDSSSPFAGVLSYLPKTVDDFLSSIASSFQEKVKLFVTQLSDVGKIFRDFNGREFSGLNETRSFIADIHEEFAEGFEMSENPLEDLENVKTKRNKLVEFLQKQKQYLESPPQNDPTLHEVLDVFHRSEQILKLPEGVYSMLKQGKVGESGIDTLDVNEQLLQLEEYEQKIYDIIVPQCRNLKVQFDKVDSFEGLSHAALDVSKWKAQNSLSDVKSLISRMAEGFDVQGTLESTLEKLKFGMSTMIQVYDRIQDYHDQAALVDYMADISSDQAKAVQVDDKTLSDAIDELQVIMKTNLVLAEYEKAMNAFRQHIFPFAQKYLREYDLPSSLRAGNSTDGLLSEAIHKINTIERKLIADELTINQSFDENVFPDIAFTSWSRKGPFYVWKYDTSAQKIADLLQGKEVFLNADVTKGLHDNAIKFKEIGIRFLLTTEAGQLDFDQVMEKFNVEMIHLGMSYFRCGTKFYVMSHDTQKIAHSVNEDENGKFSHFNSVYKKISKNEPMLSPYTMWKVRLTNVNSSFESLAKFKNEIIDLALEGRGMYVDRGIDKYVCNNHLDRFYRVDGTLREVPSVDYKANLSLTEAAPLLIRRRRSFGNGGGNDLAFLLENDTSYNDVISPQPWFIQWLTGKGESLQEFKESGSWPDHNVHQYPSYNHTGSFPYHELSFNEITPETEENSMPLSEKDVNPLVEFFELVHKGTEDYQSSSRQESLNSPSNLLLQDLLAGVRTGAAGQYDAKKNFVPDDEYSRYLAYHAPESESEIIIVQ